MKPEGRVLRADEWFVAPMESHADGAAFIRRWHYSGSTANTSVYRHGLFRHGSSRLWGVTLWMPPTKSAGKAISGSEEFAQSVLNLSRMACHPACPKNTASFLLARSRKLVDRGRWPILVTYADKDQGHTGAIYLADNWQFDCETKAGTTWMMPDGTLCTAKRGPRNLTVAEMKELGAVKRPTSIKLRFSRWR